MRICSSKPNGKYRLWVQAIDINGNEAAWQQLDVDLDLDMTSPTLSTISLRAQPVRMVQHRSAPFFPVVFSVRSHSGAEVRADAQRGPEHTQLTAASTIYTSRRPRPISSVVKPRSTGQPQSIGPGQSSAKHRNAKHRILLRPLPADTSRFILNRVAHHQHASGAVLGKRFRERIGVLRFDGCRHDNQRGWLIMRTERCVPRRFLTGLRASCQHVTCRELRRWLDLLINVDTVAPVLNAASVAGLTANQWGTATSANISLTFKTRTPTSPCRADRAYAFIQATARALLRFR